jgi:hypothetical protein
MEISENCVNKWKKSTRNVSQGWQKPKNPAIFYLVFRVIVFLRVFGDFVVFIDFFNNLFFKNPSFSKIQ